MKISFLSGLVLAHGVLAKYQLLQDYTGNAFFENFDFFTGPDPTDGHVIFRSMEQANATGLAGFLVRNTTERAVYLGVDSTQVAPQGRGSVRVESVQKFNHGLFIADIAHMPGGVCGIWPAFWMVGPSWPASGEIDIVEGVNLQTANSMTLHTATSAVINDSEDYSGRLVTSDCWVDAAHQPKNAGCSIGDVSNLTFGADFNTVGGGIFATEWTSNFIKIWFFPRGLFPDDVLSSQPEPSDNWGPPNSIFQGDFNIDDHFKNLQIVFDTTFCGSWAGASEVWNSSSCAQVAPTCEEWVANNPKAFRDAYWAINSFQVFEDDSTIFTAQDLRI